MVPRHLVLSVAALSWAVFASLAGAQTLVLNTDDIHPLSNEAGTGVEDLILKEAFRRIGRGVEIIHLPSERALVEANAGRNDGNFVRVEGLELSYPNLLMVPERIMDFEFAAFTADPAIKVADWSGLRPYDVAIIRGWKILEAKVVDTRGLEKVPDETSLFRMLESGRVQVAVFDRLQGLYYLRTRGVAGIRVVEPPLARQPMYLYLHKSHADLIDRLAAALREMRRDGSIGRILEAGL